MSSAESSVIGLFPLGIVLLPGEIAPLHVFEERYRLLVRERLDGGEFGVVLADEDKLQAAGCTARVAEVIEEFDDGRMNILVEGVRRFVLEELRPPQDPEAEYMSATVTYFDDDYEGASGSLRDRVLEVFRQMLLLMDVESPRSPEAVGPLSFRVAAAVDFGAPLKQRLLESRSESERLELLLGVMRTLLPRLELRKDREEAIRGNGKGY